MPAMAETVFSQLPQLAGNQAVLDNLRRHGNRLSGTILILSYVVVAIIKLYLDKQFIKFVAECECCGQNLLRIASIYF